MYPNSGLKIRKNSTLRLYGPMTQTPLKVTKTLFVLSPTPYGRRTELEGGEN